MTKFQIEIKEVLSRIVDIEAINETEAIEIVRDKYRNCTIILDTSDYVETKISVKR